MFSMVMSVSNLWEMVKNREAWSAMVHGLQRVRHDWATEQQHWNEEGTEAHAGILPGESCGQRSLVGYSHGVAKSRAEATDHSYTGIHMGMLCVCI